MKKIYIAGCGGMLGEAFYHTFKEDFQLKCSDKDVNEEWLSYLDFRDHKSYEKDVINYSPDILIHLGAHTSLEYCEVNEDDAYVTNTIAVENAILIANQLKIPLVYISTAGIFDGHKKVYDDWDAPNPLGVYARTKYLGERDVISRVENHLVLRAGWMMGGGAKKDKKFIYKIIKQIEEGNKEIFVVDDKFGTPTYTFDFAKNTKLLINERQWGIYNMVCQGQTSRLEVCTELLKLLNLESSVKINVVQSDYFSSEYFAPRPGSEILINKKLDLKNMNLMSSWKDALNEYLHRSFPLLINRK